jgi:glycosyltransferase involved in cell wall biosynthesis
VEATERGDSPVNTKVKGTFEGVEFEYTYGATARPASRLRRRLLKLAKWWRFLAATRAWAPESGGVEAIIVYSRTISWIAAARVACWVTGAVLVHEDVERPFVWQADSPRMWVRRWAYEHLAFKTFDGCLAISTHLRDYCAAHVRPGAEVLVVPILVDVDEFAAGDGAGVTREDRVAYCGSLSHPQSLSVVEAFAGVADEFPGLGLLLIGGSRRAEAETELRELAGRLGVAERVEFAGKVPREDLLRLLQTARVLLLPRPRGAAAEAAAEAALPTKVGEYLAAGRPVVVAGTSDIPLYLKDGVDAYMTPSGDMEAFTERLRYVLHHPEEADAVGRRGRETAKECFDPVVHGARILAFIEELRQADATSLSRRRVAVLRLRGR